jgi:predicted enzyme related to lactoylglutathione lyase
MKGSPPRFAGVELYFHDLDRARSFYREILGLDLADEEPGHYARFDSGAGFVCLERKGSEQYSSRDKAVLFFEVEDLAAARAAIGPDRFVHNADGWAVLHDPEGHNVLLVERKPPEGADGDE